MLENFDGGNLTMLFVGALFCILGYLIAIKQMRYLIAGWDESKITNPTAFANMVGGSILFEGFAFTAIALAEGAGIISDVYFVSALFAIAITPIVVLVVAIKRYRKRT